MLYFFALDVLLLKMGKKSVPVLVGHLRVFGELLLDHKFFDAVDWMDVAHTVRHDSHHCLQVLVVAHRCDCVTLDQYVAIS